MNNLRRRSREPKRVCSSAVLLKRKGSANIFSVETSAPVEAVSPGAGSPQITYAISKTSHFGNENIFSSSREAGKIVSVSSDQRGHRKVKLAPLCYSLRYLGQHYAMLLAHVNVRLVRSHGRSDCYVASLA